MCTVRAVGHAGSIMGPRLRLRAVGAATATATATAAPASVGLFLGVVQRWMRGRTDPASAIQKGLPVAAD